MCRCGVQAGEFADALEPVRQRSPVDVEGCCGSLPVESAVEKGFQSALQIGASLQRRQQFGQSLSEHRLAGYSQFNQQLIGPIGTILRVRHRTDQLE